MIRLINTYLSVAGASLFQRGKIPQEQRRSYLFCLAFITGFPLIFLSTQLFLTLDYLVSPWFRKTPIDAPVFIVGNPRSGTTILHRVMSLDRQFFFFRSWEMFFPSIIQKRVFDALGWCDRLLGQPFVRILSASEQRRFEKFNRLHEVGLFLPEEDEKLLMHILAAPDMGFIFPYGDFSKFALFDDEVAPHEQNQIMSFYDSCVRRQAYLRGRGSQPRLLSKNPSFTGKVDLLRQRYHDARLIHLVRSPLEAIPSMISLVRSLVVGSFGTQPGPDLDETIFQIAKRYYLDTPVKLEKWPTNRCLTVDYRELVRRPEETIRQIYSQLELNLSPEFAESLRQEAEKMRQHKSSHRYSLNQCQISRERIVSELQPIFARFGFETGTVVNA